MLINRAMIGIAILVGLYGAGVLIEAYLPVPLPANIGAVLHSRDRGGISAAAGDPCELAVKQAVFCSAD